MRALLDTIAVCEAAFRELEIRIPVPVRVAKGDDFAFRYEEHTPQVVVVQKLSRVLPLVSEACLVLLEHGLYQEVGAIFRMLKEFDEEVQFMCEAIRVWSNDPNCRNALSRNFFNPSSTTITRFWQRKAVIVSLAERYKPPSREYLRTL